MVWNVTSECNFSCKHCYIPSAARDLTTEEAKKLIEQLEGLGVEELYLSGGEPLLRKDIFSLIECAANSGLEVGAITNGWLVTPAVANSFAKSGVAHVSVSVDGIGETHDRFRNKPGSFKRCIRAIKLLREAGLKVYLSPTLSKLNLRELPELLGLALELGADFSTKVLVPIGRASILKKHCLSAEEQKGVYEYLLRKASELGIDIVTTCNPYAVVLRKKKPAQGKRIRGGCTGGVSLLNIGSDGTVYPCSRLQLPLGDVRREALEEIWNSSSEVLDSLRDRDKLKGKCGTCEYRYWCGGCRAMALALRGDYLAEDPTCWLA